MHPNDLKRIIRVEAHDMLEDAESRLDPLDFAGHRALRALRDQVAQQLTIMQYLETITWQAHYDKGILPG